MFAVHHQDEWNTLSPDEAVERMRPHFQGVWDSRACVGTATHSVMESWFCGETVDLHSIVCDLAANEHKAKTWIGREDEMTAHLVPYIDGLERWWTDFSPSGGTSEDCVRMPGVYIGQRDRWEVEMRGDLWGLDLKTSAEHNIEKAIYLDSWSLQLSAYSRAPEIVEYGWNADGKLAEIGTRPNKPVDRHGIIHLRGDGNYALYEVPVTDESFDAFMALAKFGHWLKSIEKVKPVEVVA